MIRNKALSVKDYKLAGTIAKTICLSDEAEPPDYVFLAEIYYRVGDSKSAISCLESAMEKWPDSSMLRLITGYIYLADNHLVEALDELEKANELSLPSELVQMLCLYKAHIYMQVGKRIEALRECEKITSDNPAHPMGALLLSRLVENAGEPEAAVKYLEQVVKVIGDRPTDRASEAVIFNLARLYGYINQTAKGFVLAVHCLEYNSRDPLNFLMVIKMAIELDAIELAHNYWEAYLMTNHGVPDLNDNARAIHESVNARLKLEDRELQRRSTAEELNKTYEL